MTKKENDLEHISNLHGLKTKAYSSPALLFFQFSCPHCEYLNVMGKSAKQEYLVCSNSTCRKIIILENYKDIA